ncbi:hypothetical protein HUU51_01235 [Candidatus Gracilibacteria bacterium]|nr:hypothetical protein [Candidatus Gracilibacteria bacterium]
MTNESLQTGTNVVKMPITTLMHASLNTKDVMFNKPFESVKDVQDFMIWLVINGSMDATIKGLDGKTLTQRECVGKDHFILSQESINLCIGALKLINKDARLLLTPGVEEQVSLIINKGRKTA